MNLRDSLLSVKELLKIPKSQQTYLLALIIRIRNGIDILPLVQVTGVGAETFVEL